MTAQIRVSDAGVARLAIRVVRASHQAKYWTIPQDRDAALPRPQCPVEVSRALRDYIVGRSRRFPFVPTRLQMEFVYRERAALCLSSLDAGSVGFVPTDPDTGLGVVDPKTGGPLTFNLNWSEFADEMRVRGVRKDGSAWDGVSERRWAERHPEAAFLAGVRALRTVEGVNGSLPLDSPWVREHSPAPRFVLPPDNRAGKLEAWNPVPQFATKAHHVHFDKEVRGRWQSGGAAAEVWQL